METNMKVFDFKCDRCGHISEHWGEFDDALFCPKCNSTRVKRVISPPNIQFKGTGFTKKFHKKGR
jgi:putative FmdB family regulatory protein